jgi:predicted ATPase
MIIMLELGNFKCFRRLFLPLRRMNVLAGLNGMGKSSVIQSFLLLRQSYAGGELADGALNLAGELADIGTGRDVLLDGAEEDTIEFGLVWADDGDRSELRLRFAYDRTADRLSLADDGQAAIREIAQRRQALPPLSGELHYICAERLGPRKFLSLSESRVRRREIGPRGEYVLHFVLAHGPEGLSEADPRLREDAEGPTVRQQIEVWLQEVSPGTIFGIDSIQAADAAIASFQFQRSGDVPTMALRPTNVGFGLSYAFPVIVALVAARPGALILVENPEAHLHPRGQTRLGQLSARAAAAGIQVIAETHSDHFLDGVRIEVREKRLEPSSVAIHYFERRGAEAQVVSPEIDGDGRLSEWPEGFFDQHEENLSRLIAPTG